MNRNTHLFDQSIAQLLNIFAFFANHDTWTGSVNGNAGSLCRTLNLNPGYRCIGKLLADVSTNLQVYQQMLSIIFTFSKPY